MLQGEAEVLLLNSEPVIHSSDGCLAAVSSKLASSEPAKKGSLSRSFANSFHTKDE